jgi:hypothetical protein
MKLQRLFIATTFAFTAGAACAAGPAATVADLGWMTGTWAAALGPNTLEENWVVPTNGSMAALVRMTGADGVGMWEMITIEEKDGSLVMNIQQWNSGFEPRAEKQTLELAEITANSVMFNAVSEGSMKSLGYSREGDTFTIHLVGQNGNPTNLPLKASGN